LLGSRFTSPLVRGPARLAEAFAFLPRVRRAVPEAELPFTRARVVAGMLAGTALLQAVRRSSLSSGTQELVGGAVSLAPALLAFGGGGALASYHGAEHIAIGSYEHGEPRPREHERCGTHLVAPLLATGFVANVLASRAPASARPAARAAATFGTFAVSMELFGWMQRHPRHPLSRALRRPGYELQHRLVTREPTPDQLEVAEAALRACLELEQPVAEAVDRPPLPA
jgi:hypothetical protein